MYVLALFEIGEELHKAREFWGIGANCPCKAKINTLDVKEEQKDQEYISTVKLISQQNASLVNNELPSLSEQNSGQTLTNETAAMEVDLNKESSEVSKKTVKFVEHVQEVSNKEDNRVTRHDDDEDFELDTIVSTTMGALTLLMDYVSPMSSPASSPAPPMDIDVTSQMTPGKELTLLLTTLTLAAEEGDHGALSRFCENKHAMKSLDKNSFVDDGETTLTP